MVRPKSKHRTQPSPCADPYTVHRTPCTVHPTPYTVHRTPYTAILLLPLLLLLFSCQKPKERIVIPAFYHWQTRLELTLPEQGLVKRLGVQRLYVKFFDVDWDPELKAPVPLAPVELAPRTYAGLELAPAVFIANRTLERLPPEQVPGLADKIYGKIFSLAAQDSSLHIREVQLDCDWTGSTREAYFELLGRLRDKLSARGIALSATIRLHQARYPARTGVPPVGRGILMFYNMGQLEQWDEPNSILNLEAAEPYLKGYEPYPLPLGLALPLFRWAVLFRDGEMIKLINNLTEERLEGNPKYKALAPGRYEVVEGAFLEGHYLYPGDRIRMEAVEPEHLIAAAERLRGLPWPDTLELVFYHLDSTVVGRYEAKMLDGLGRILKGS
ncbi:MAG: hypothetical protein H6557_09880 [Lewinellaceae bacterium]|nr:hypothetical protein [Phaeodactylibacter sp.]MCB9036916.1 hypothetical protein [Lewinellaceae bacterium]